MKRGVRTVAVVAGALAALTLVVRLLPEDSPLDVPDDVWTHAGKFYDAPEGVELDRLLLQWGRPDGAPSPLAALWVVKGDSAFDAFLYRVGVRRPPVFRFLHDYVLCGRDPEGVAGPIPGWRRWHRLSKGAERRRRTYDPCPYCESEEPDGE